MTRLLIAAAALAFAAVLVVVLRQPAPPLPAPATWAADCCERCLRVADVPATPTVAREYSRRRWP